jgi:cell pole-organizing protein PopZ
MSELPPNIDAILASIRSRMNEETPPPPSPPAAAPEATPVVTDIGAVVLENGSMTLDNLIRSLLEPMLKTWLDANMPEIVERMAQDEIKRLTGQD